MVGLLKHQQYVLWEVFFVGFDTWVFGYDRRAFLGQKPPPSNFDFDPLKN